MRIIPGDPMHNEPLLKAKKRLSRRERERLRQRRDMLDAALDLFTLKGYHNVTMHEIAEKAEFAVGTLYKFFKNKEDLYKALILERLEEFHQSIVAALEGQEDEVERLRRYIETKSAIFRSHVPMIRLYFSEAYGEGFNLMADLNAQIRQRHEDHLGMIAAVFESGMRKNRFKRTADPLALAVALDGTINAFLFRWLEEPAGAPFPEEAGMILDILLKGQVD
jgi:TetR/AcrR family transcriptional regulator